MSDDERPGRQGPAVSRRGIIQWAGGAALATAAVTALGSGGAGGKPAGALPLGGRVGDPVGPDFRLVSESADLLIHDGTPYWWDSPDIWPVPGSDPYGATGAPVAGDQAYVWARVTNTGRDDAVGVRVSFYWANPSVQMRFSTINLIGVSYADIAAGETQDVLCLVPWNVVTVNGGHECLVVTAQLPNDPPLPDIVDPPAYPNVAQRNLTVVSGLRKGDFRLTVTANALQRETKKVRIAWELGGELPKETLASLGIKQSRPASTKATEVRLAADPEGKGEPALDLVIPAGKSVPFYVTVHGTAALGPDEYQVVRVIERQQNQILGGISFVVVAE